MKSRLAQWMRDFADRIDREGAPKCTGLSFTFEPGVGTVLHGQLGVYTQGQPGCLLWYLNDREREKAYESLKPMMQAPISFGSATDGPGGPLP